ncbi:MAG: NfeD family protein [Treponema sp.]|jgi:membrane protein implicated in regulation of membrane protease activity|nr:NfeD family protein [Treponema sp.]
MLTAFGFISVRWLWVALVIVFALIELFTLGLTTVWFALAALVMVFLSLLPIPLVFQILIFLGVSALLLIFTRPLAVKKFRMGKEKTNVDSLIGRHALVVKAIGEFEKGEVKIGGQIWSALSEDNSEIREGTKCEIVRIEGVRAVVRPVPAESADSSGTPASAGDISHNEV